MFIFAVGDVALLLCEKRHASPSEAVAGDGCHSEGPGRGLMSAFNRLGGGLKAYLHMEVLSDTHSLTQPVLYACAPVLQG